MPHPRRKRLSCAALLTVLLIVSPRCFAHPTLSPEPRVTIRATRITLRTLASKLTAATSVHYSADSEIADLHVSLNVRNLPASAFRSRLAELMNLSWRTVTCDSGEDRFNLYRSAKNRALEDELVNQEERDFRKGVETLLKVASLSDAEIDRLARTDWRLRGTLSQPGAREAIGLMAALTPAERESVISGKPLSFTPDHLPQQLEDKINGYLSNACQGLSESARALALQPAMISVGRLGQGRNSCLYVGMELKGHNSGGGFATHLMSNGGAESSPSPREIGSDSSETRYKIATSIRTSSMDAALAALAESDFPFIAESYAESGSASRSIAPGEHVGSELAGRLLLSNQTCRKSGSVWLFQRERWWEDRKSEIPDELLADIKQTMKNGVHSLEEWSRLGALNSQQWPWLTTLRLGELNELQHLLPALRLFHDLGPNDRRALFSAGTSASRLRPSARTALAEWIKARGKADEQLDQVVDVLLSAQVETDGTRFTARAVLSDGSQTICCQELINLLPESALKQRVASANH